MDFSTPASNLASYFSLFISIFIAIFLNEWISESVSINGYEFAFTAINCGNPQQGSALGSLLFLFNINQMILSNEILQSSSLCLSIKKLNKLVNAGLKHLQTTFTFVKQNECKFTIVCPEGNTIVGDVGKILKFGTSRLTKNGFILGSKESSA